MDDYLHDIAYAESRKRVGFCGQRGIEENSAALVWPYAEKRERQRCKQTPARIPNFLTVAEAASFHLSVFPSDFAHDVVEPNTSLRQNPCELTNNAVVSGWKPKLLFTFDLFRSTIGDRD
jgi:hypothetical protein